MKQIAVILDQRVLYWTDVILVLAALTAALAFLSFWLARGGGVSAGFFAAGLGIILSLVFSRLVHWCCCRELYESGDQAGGFALVGCFLGCALAAAVTRLLRLHTSLPGMLDCMSLAGCLGIFLGRLASFFDASDRGQLLTVQALLPWAWPVLNPVSGQQELRLATFFLQAIGAFVLFLALLAAWLVPGKWRREGETALRFLLLYCAMQYVLDSTRYDSLYFPMNRFVSVVQVACGLTLGAVLVMLLVRRKKREPLVWLTLAGLMGLAGYLEYAVQRHGDQSLPLYSLMTVTMVVLCALGLWLQRQTSMKQIPSVE